MKWMLLMASSAVCTLALAQSAGRPEPVEPLGGEAPLAFTSDGQYLISLYTSNLDGRQTLQARRIAEGDTPFVVRYTLPKGKYLRAVSPDARLLAVSALSQCEGGASGYLPESAGQLELVDFPSGKVLQTLQDFSLCGMGDPVFSPDQALLAVPNRQGYVELWKTSGQRLSTLVVSGEPGAVSFSRDGQWLAVCGGRLEVYRVADGVRVLRLPAEARAASSCREAPPAFTPDGSGLLLADGRKPVGLWSLPSGRLLRSFAPREGQPAQQVAVDGSGRFVLTLDQGQGLAVYAAKSGQMLYQTRRGGYGLVTSPSLEVFATAYRAVLWRLR